MLSGGGSVSSGTGAGASAEFDAMRGFATPPLFFVGRVFMPNEG